MELIITGYLTTLSSQKVCNRMMTAGNEFKRKYKETVGLE